MKSKQPITDALKAAIEASGLPFLTLEQKTGVTRQSLMAFMKGQRTLRLDMADKLADYFALKVQSARKTNQRPN